MSAMQILSHLILTITYFILLEKLSLRYVTYPNVPEAKFVFEPITPSLHDHTLVVKTHHSSLENILQHEE